MVSLLKQEIYWCCPRGKRRSQLKDMKRVCALADRINVNRERLADDDIREVVSEGPVRWQMEYSVLGASFA